MDDHAAKMNLATGHRAWELPPIVVHFCSGNLWDECFTHQVLAVAKKQDRSVIVLAIDPCLSAAADLLNEFAWSSLQELAHSG